MGFPVPSSVLRHAVAPVDHATCRRQPLDVQPRSEAPTDKNFKRRVKQVRILSVLQRAGLARIADGLVIDEAIAGVSRHGAEAPVALRTSTAL